MIALVPYGTLVNVIPGIKIGPSVGLDFDHW